MKQGNWNQLSEIQKKDREKEILKKGFFRTMKNARASSPLSSPPRFGEFILLETFDEEVSYGRSTTLRKSYIKEN